MDDPDAESGEGKPVVFKATEGHHLKAAEDKKSGKASSSEKLRARRSTPRPIFKGAGKKRVGFSPSPVSKQGKKRAQHVNLWEKSARNDKNKRNLLEELNVAAGEAASDPVQSPATGAGTADSVASPLTLPCEGEGIERVVASPLSTEEKGEGTECKVASPHPVEMLGEGTGGPIASPLTTGGEGVGIVSQVASPQSSDMLVTCSGDGNGMEVKECGSNEKGGESPSIRSPSPEHTLSSPEQVPENRGNSDMIICSEAGEDIVAGATGEQKWVVGREGQGPYTVADKGDTPAAATLDGSTLVTISGNKANLGQAGSTCDSTKKAIFGPQNDSMVIRSTQENKSNFESGNECVLDLIAAQPLQVNRHVSYTSAASWASEVPTVQPHVNRLTHEFDTNFPPLVGGSTKKLREFFENKKDHETHRPKLNGGGIETPEIWTETSQKSTPPTVSQNPSGGAGTTSPKAHDTVLTMAAMVKNGDTLPAPREHIPFKPNKITKIGTAGVSQNKPAIFFSGEDTKFLADKMGYTVVGKFSHSIPSSTQIQAALGKIGLVGACKWNFINAKHIEIKIDNLEDYAKLLNGPGGTPVWFVEHHPMRVFKWTPTFDPFFETPIAAVWCNLIGLPIHLFEESALFAIGGLLGTPIQIDHATANRSRLSFARICVEIDISKPQPEEIILDIMGKEIKQRVKWDKIPLYCGDCMHVGHTSRSCYAFGKKEGPRTYADSGQHNTTPAPGARKDGYTNEGEAAESSKAGENRERLRNGLGQGANVENGNRNGNNGGGRWQQQRRRGRKPKTNNANFFNGNRNQTHNPVDHALGVPKTATPSEQQDGNSSRGSPPKSGIPNQGTSSNHSGNRFEVFSKPKYYRQLENGEFDTECYEDAMDEECDLKLQDTMRGVGSRPPNDGSTPGSLHNENLKDSGKLNHGAFRSGEGMDASCRTTS